MADDGRLAFGISFDYDEFVAQAEKIKSELKSIGDSAIKEGKHIDSVFADLGNKFDVSTAEARFNALRQAISENEQEIKKATDAAKNLSKDVNDALSEGNFQGAGFLQKKIDDIYARVADLNAQTQDYKHVLNEVEEAAGKVTSSLPSQPVSLFYASEEDYKHVQELSASIEELQSKLAHAKTDEEFTELNAQLIDLQDELDDCNTAASQAASSLGGKLGESAAEASTKVYELNAAVEKQTKIYNDLAEEYKKVEENLKKATKEGDAKKIKELQLEYQELSKKLQDASNTLESLKGKQKDASKLWDGMSKNLQENNSGLVKLLGGQEKYNTIISNLPGPLKSAVSGIMGMVKAAKAFIATPLGKIIAVIVAALSAMKKAFTSTAEGQQKFAKATGYLKGILQYFEGVVIKVGNALINAFKNPKEAVINLGKTIKDALIKYYVTLGKIAKEVGLIMWKSLTFQWDDINEHVSALGDILKDIGETVVDAVKGVAQGIDEIAKKRAAIEEAYFVLEEKEKQWQVQRVKLEEDAQKKLEAVRNSSLTGEERKKALEEYGEILEQINKSELYYASQRVSLKKQEMALAGGDTKENRMALAEAQRAVAQANLELQRKQVTMQRLRNTTDKEILSETKAATEEELRALRNRQQAEIDIMEDGAEKKLAQLKLDYAKQLDEIEKRERELKEKQKGELTLKQQQQFTEERKNAMRRYTKFEMEAYAEMLEQNDADYRRFLDGVDEMSVKAMEKLLRRLKIQYQQLLTSGLGIDSEQIKKLIAQIQYIEKVIKERNLTPSEKDAEDWGKLDDKLQSLCKSAETLGDTIGGALGELVKFNAQFLSVVSSTVGKVKELKTQIGEAGIKAADTLTKIEAASVVLSILSEVRQLLNEITDSIQNLKEQVGDDEDVQWLQSVLDVLQSLVNLVGGKWITDSIWSAIKGDYSNMMSAEAKWDNQLAQINRRYKELQRTIASTYSTDRENAINQANAELEKKRQRLLEQIWELEKRRDNIASMSGLARWGSATFGNYTWTSEDLALLNQLYDELDDIENQIEDNRDAAVDAIFGEDIQSAISNLASALTDAWDQGKSAAESAKDFINGIMKNMLQEALMKEIQNNGLLDRLQSVLRRWFNSIDWSVDYTNNRLLQGVTDAAEGVFALAPFRRLNTIDDIEGYLTDWFDSLSNSPFAEWWRSLSTPGDRTANAAGIAQASQESIDELNGRITAIQGHTFNLSENSNIIRDNVATINGNVQLIRINTDRMVSSMDEMRGDIRYMRTHGSYAAQQ